MKSFLFPGQGSQHVGMGEGLFDAFPDLTAAADAILGYSIRELCLHDPARQLTQTQFTQPALYVVNALTARQKQREGERPDFAAGHSLGEYNALEIAGVFGFEDGLRLVQKRGALMAQAAPGGMAAIIGIDAGKVAEVLAKAGLGTIDVANYNQATQTVISGLREEVTGAQAAFEAAGAMFVPLNVGGAFHSRYMQPAATEYARFLQGFQFSAPLIPVIANVTGRPHEDSRIAETLALQLTHSVRWVDGMHWLLQQGVTGFVEAGPRDVLTKMIRGIRAQWKPQAVAAAAVVAPTPVADAPRTALPATDVVAAWNRSHPVGTRVSAKGYEQPLATRTEAMVLFGHRAAVYLQGYNGYFALEDVRAV